VCSPITGKNADDPLNELFDFPGTAVKIALIINPGSGNHQPGKIVPRLMETFRTARIEADLFFSRSVFHLRSIARRIQVSDYDVIAPVGGDGTNFHVINGLLSGHPGEDLPPLAVIPAGSGNSFARDLGIFTPDQAVAAIIRCRPRPVDVLRFTGRKQSFWFVNLMGLGFVTEVARTAARFRAFRDLSYLIGVVHQTLFLAVHHLELTVDGRPFSGQNCFVEFCNSRYTGGSMLMAPSARIDDGLMDIIIVSHLTRRRLLRALPKIFTGDHIHMDEVTHVKGRTARFTTSPVKTLLPDGEMTGHTPGQVDVLPGRLCYLF